jgi:hypothetical protein
MPHGRTPCIIGGQAMKVSAPSIWRPADAEGKPRCRLPAENGKFPDTKHTTM